MPNRIRWAVEQLELGPTTRVLEFGGGAGTAAWLICPRLRSGTLLEIDRSPTAVARIRKRCAEYLASGRLAVLQAALSELDVADASVDVAFGVDVNLFWTTSAAIELALLHRALVPGGQLLIAYGQSPGGAGQQQSVLQRVRDNVESAGFGGVRIVIEPSASAVTARRSSATVAKS